MGWTKRFLVLAGLLLAALAPASAQAPRRIALVMGNAAYTTQGWALANPVNDATLIAARLRTLGFEVDPVMNATRPQMEAAFGRFGDRLKNAGPDAVGLFYYAGHGAQKDGVNLLVPVDVTARTMDQLRYQAPAMQFLLDDMGEAGNAVNIIILDACRNTPLIDSARAGPGRGGLAELAQAPPDVLIAYATRAGYTAPDNPGERNSVFTRTLAEALATQPGDRISSLFEDVNARVYSLTGGAQRPEYRNGIVRAPNWSLAAASPAAADTRIANENAELRRQLEEALRARAPSPVPPGAGTTSSPAVAVQRPDAGVVARAPGAVFRDCAECPEMIAIPGGTFLMGSSASEPGRATDEGPQRYVTVRAFAAGKYEVTFDEWDACARGGGCAGYAPDDRGWGRGRQPVMNVSWTDAQAYVTWLNGRAGGARYRLLSEAEWEYAARAGTTTAYSTGAAISTAQANHNNALQKTAPVGSYAPNPFGLHDMHGNVWEWTQDCFVNSYSALATDGSANTTGDCSNRVIRGGSWSDFPDDLRSAGRLWDDPAIRFNSLGFRVARTPF